MQHLHKASGLVFECGELVDFRECDSRVRCTYDMTVITHWNHRSFDNDLQPPVIIGYYFGEYDEATTDYYIDRWLEKQAADNLWRRTVSDCEQIVNAYWLTNEDVLRHDEYKNAREKVQRTLTNLERIMEVLNNEK